MLATSDFFESLQLNGVRFFTGVPDSLLKSFCAYLEGNCEPEQHTISANEGSAVSLALGYHLATGEIPLIYLQNSGLGNTINPIASLAHKEIYSIPMLLMIGWRGEPNVADEPQHVFQGQVTLDTLKLLQIPFSILDKDSTDYESTLKSAVEIARKTSGPYGLVVKKNTFSNYKLEKQGDITNFEMSREVAIETILQQADANSIVVSTTGMASREVFEVRVRHADSHERDFLTVGGMGHCSQIALGIALQQPEKTVYCLDGDGAVLMHMGGLAIVGQSKARNLRHIVLNNGAHDSVGGQPTCGLKIDFCKIASACGYESVSQCADKSTLVAQLATIKSKNSPSFLEVLINKGSRKDLGRPTISPQENKNNLMNYIKNS